MLTDEQLQQALREIHEGLDSLPKPGKPITKEQKKQGYLLVLKKQALETIKAAKEKQHTSDEMHHTMIYSMLNSWVGKHPMLIGFLKSRLRWDMF